MKKLNQSHSGIFIVGTDTSVGKTVVSLLLMQFFYKYGIPPFYLKPMQTGCKSPTDTESDARFIYEHIPELKFQNPKNSILYCFKTAKAPLFAAQNESSKIPFFDMINTINQKIEDHAPVIIEGAGGLMVPIDQTNLIIDLISNINAIPIIVGRAGLGTINHCLLTIDALKIRSINPLGVILSDSGALPVSDEMLKENIEAIENFSKVKVLGVIKKIDNFNYILDEYFEMIKKILTMQS
ncbi:ATP-dependent dethiobiotin synthetase BioD [Candidatus Magnetomorum sp. HK-1]|nr:ATP-dependent dethiobiotin synthetase BioD [Candidatus Magnetomorum sp. HK-1]